MSRPTVSIGTLSLAATLSLGLADAASAVVLVNDTWSDGTRNDPGPPAYSEYGEHVDDDGDLESAWFRGGSGGLGVVGEGGPLRGTTVAASSASWTTYFAPEATPVTLNAAGDQLRITWVFTPTGVVEAHDGLSFRIAVVDSPSAARLASDTSPSAAAYAGYAMLGTLAGTLNHNNPFSLYERTNTAVAGDFLSATGGVWSYVDDEDVAGIPGYEDGVSYTFVFSATRTADDALEIEMSMTGGDLGGDGVLSITFTDTTPNTLTFDTFGIRPSRGDQTAEQFDATLFRVEFNQVPEPASLSLALLGCAAIACRPRRRANA